MNIRWKPLPDAAAETPDGGDGYAVLPAAEDRLVQFIEETLPDVSCAKRHAHISCASAPDTCLSKLEDGEPLLKRLRVLLEVDGGLPLLVTSMDVDHCPCRAYH